MENSKSTALALVSEEKLHATFSASGSSRWLACPGSIALSAKAPEGRDSSYAKEGTEAHSVLETLIKNRKNRAKTVIFLREKYPTPMIIHAEMALDEIERRLKTAPGAELHSEIRCDLPVSEPDQFGTTDVAIVEHFGLLEVIDYKYGAGIPVSPVENSQLIYYALGLAHQYDYNFETVRLTVIQPRAQVDGKFVRSWDLSVEDLLGWKDKFEAGVQAAKAKDAPLVPGSGDKNHCRFCSAAVICPALGQASLKRAQIAFAPEKNQLTVPDPKKIPVAHLSEILDAAERIDAWLTAVRDHAFNIAKRGEKIKGYKLVQKRGTRKWLDVIAAEKSAKKFFGDDAFDPPTLKSPAQLEKLGKAAEDFVEKLTTNVSSGYTLVDEGDSRPAVNPAADVFDDEKSSEKAITPALITADGAPAPKVSRIGRGRK